MRFLLILITLSCPVVTTAAEIETVLLDSFFTSVDGPGAFILLDVHSGHMRVHNSKRARTRFIPASTFKIPNSMIALETGVASGPDFAIPWDSTKVQPKKWWPKRWRRNQTMQTAFANSVFWYYQEIARQIGSKRMQTYLRQFDYGNQDIAPAIDTFWLYGDIRISPFEQVNFLHRFLTNKLGLRPATTQHVKTIMQIEKTKTYRLYGKTGTAEVTPTRELGWMVGFVESQGKTHIYALNMEGERVWEEWPPNKRANLVKRILTSLNAIE